jgi:hypothetical protein
LVDLRGTGVRGQVLPGGGQLGEHDVEQGGGLGVEVTSDRGHPVAALAAHLQTALGLLVVVVGFGAVGIDDLDKVIGELLQILRTHALRPPRQVTLGVGARRLVDPWWELGEELANNLDVGRIDQPFCQGGRRGVPLRG